MKIMDAVHPSMHPCSGNIKQIRSKLVIREILNVIRVLGICDALLDV